MTFSQKFLIFARPEYENFANLKVQFRFEPDESVLEVENYHLSPRSAWSGRFRISKNMATLQKFLSNLKYASFWARTRNLRSEHPRFSSGTPWRMNNFLSKKYGNTSEISVDPQICLILSQEPKLLSKRLRFWLETTRRPMSFLAKIGNTSEISVQN